MNKLIVPLALLFIAVTLQLSYAEDKTTEQKLMPIGIELNNAHKKLQKTTEHLNEINLPSFNENCFSQLALLNIEKISALCSSGSSFILFGECVKEECRANYYNRALGILKFIEDQITLCLERTDVARDQLKGQGDTTAC